MTAPPAAAMARARELLGTGRAGEAADALRGVLAAAPGRVDALYMLGQAEIRQGRYEQAGSALRAARRLRPGHRGILHALAGVALALGHAEEAVSLLEEAAGRFPREPRLWHALGLARHAAGLHRAALEAHERALALDPRRPEAAVGRGKVLQVLGRLDDARDAFEAVLARWPEHAEAREGLAVQLELRGRYREALERLGPPPAAAPEPVATRVVRARLLRRLGRAGEGLALLAGLPEGSLPAPERRAVAFESADALDALGRHGEAFARYREANALAPGRWDAAAHEARVAALRGRWDAAALSALAGGGNDDETPLFVVGMPRSGTTLVEQILARHPGVHAAGELEAIGNAARRLRGPDGVPEPGKLTPELAAQAAADWLEAAGGAGTARRVDKMPANFMHLGLVQALFPRARVVWCRRDPRDAGLSCFRQDFSGLGLAWTRSLEDIAAYHGSVETLMEYWRATLALPLLVLRYEDLVSDPERRIRELVAFAGLPRDEACERFEAGDRLALTASHAQVRDGLHGGAVGRYRDYETWLEPLAAAGRAYEEERGG